MRLKSLNTICRDLRTFSAVFLTFLHAFLGAPEVSDAAEKAGWRTVYSQSFNGLPVGTTTASKALPEWESGSAAGVVFDGKSKAAGRFLVARSAWTSFNQGPILNLDLTSVPHDRVRVQFDLYTFGDWRGLQRATGGPQHRLMFSDTQAKPRFSFDTSFSTNPGFKQSWPGRNPAQNKAGTKGTRLKVDTTGRFQNAFRWPIEFEYPSTSQKLRFAILCGAAAGSGKPMPAFAIDNVRVSVRSTAPVITPIDRPADIRLAKRDKPEPHGAKITFNLKSAERVSLGVFDQKTGRLIRTLLRAEKLPAGQHTLYWDGRDNRGRAAAKGDYEWRLLSAPGFTARYITTIGINPPGGEHPVPRYSWVGDHSGAGIIDVDDSGVYIGAVMTEGMMMLVKADPSMSRILWRRPQFYQGGRLTGIAVVGKHLFTLHPTGKLRRFNKANGRVEAVWQIGNAKNPPSDLDANDANLVVSLPHEKTIRWISKKTGKAIAEVSLADVTCASVIGTEAKGAVVAAIGRDLFEVMPGKTPRRVATLDGKITATDYDAKRKELWAVVNGSKVHRLNADFKVVQTYGNKPRPQGPFDPKRFAGVYDIAADRNGGFFVGEPWHAPRRIARFDRDGKVIGQWFGGMSFYVNATFDPDDPARLYGLAPEGWLNVYKIDFTKGTWTIEASYATGRLGDSLFPNMASFRAVRKNGQTYLYHRVVPAVLRLDPKRRKVIPVAIAGRVLNRGRTFFQFAGTGRDGYPKPWVKAAEHHGYKNLRAAPKLFSWADSDGDGEFDPEEFRFYPKAKLSVSFHNPGDFMPNGDYIASARVNAAKALLRLPVTRWEDPNKSAPRWDWSKLSAQGPIQANAYGYGSPRGLSVGSDGSITVAYQAGIMIRSHGQYEGGGWPEVAVRGSRVLRFDSRFRPTFEVGRQSKSAAEANTGVLYYPMQTTRGPNRSVVVNDQTRQPAQVWTHDGLYVGGFFDNRAKDGRPDGFYQVHGDDNQGAAIVTTKTGKTYWLMPYVGHNRLYEITGWKNWRRQNGKVKRPDIAADITKKGTGLTASYYNGKKLVFSTTEPPICYERFGRERHTGKVKPHFKVVWSGFVEPPASDQFQFRSLLGKNEQVAVWIDGRIVHANGFKKPVIKPAQLIAGHRHRIRVEYINPAGRAELKLLWSSRVVDPTRLPTSSLFSELPNSVK